MKYLAKKDANGVYMLSINGVASVCPYTPPFVAQGRLGMEIQRLGCSSQCPHFRIKEYPTGETTLELSCGKGEPHPLTIEEETKKPTMIVS